jgi:protein-S-isoprenylcysteine O-methyltransferase Ste14
VPEEHSEQLYPFMARSGVREEKTNMKQWEPSVYFKMGRLVAQVELILGPVIFFYNYFFGSYLGFDILLYIGWIIFAVGLPFLILGPYTLNKRGKAVEGEITILVDSGIFAVIRHPFYLGVIMLVSASMLISQHWLTLILGVPVLAWFFLYALPWEDKELIEIFGDDYKRYIKKVPRINFVVGLIRQYRK